VQLRNGIQSLETQREIVASESAVLKKAPGMQSNSRENEKGELTLAYRKKISRGTGQKKAK